MIASIQVDVVRIDDECHADQHEHFDALRTSIDNIAIEYVGIFIGRQPILEQKEIRDERIRRGKEEYFMKDDHQIG